MGQHQARRKFITLGASGLLAAFLGIFSKAAMAAHHPGKRKGIVVHEEEGIHILTGRRKAPMHIKISKTHNEVDNISFCTEDIIPGRKLRIHKHLYHDELIFIHKGEGLFTLDNETIHVKTGTVVFVPRNVWHGLENTGKDNINMVFQYAPAGFEEYFIANGTIAGMPTKERTESEYADTAKKYGMVYKDPR